MGSKEILTIQSGIYSNYVGTHFWNSQFKALRSSEENVTTRLFRETTDDRQQHVPRLISFDFKTNLRSLKLDGSFKPPADETEIQNGFHDSATEELDCDYVTYKHTEIGKNNLQEEVFNVDGKVESWSDYMDYKLNDNSIQTLQNRFEDESQFMFHGSGYSDYKLIRDDFEDKLHFWIEECNWLDGFMILTDIHDGFCGVTTRMLEELKDDYGNKTFLPFMNCFSTESNHMDAYQLLNTALTFQSFDKNSSLFVLQSLKDSFMSKSCQDVLIPNISYKDDIYHTSAILASAIDSVIIPWKDLFGPGMLETCRHISQDKWKLAGTAIGFSCAKSSDGISLFEEFISKNGFYGNLTTSLFPLGFNDFSTPVTQSLVFREKSAIAVPNFEPKVLQSLGLNHDIFYRNPRKLLEFFTEQWYPSNRTSSCMHYIKEGFNLSRPMSSLFECPDDDNDGPAIVSSLFTSASFYTFLSDLISKIRCTNYNRYHHVQEVGFDFDTRNELLEDLFDLAERYNLENPCKEIYD